MDRQAVTAFLMSLIAGLSTGLGGLIVVFSDGASTAFLSFALAFSAGIMVTVSLADLLPTAAAAFVGSYGPGKGAVMLLIPMVMGIFFAQLIDALTPEAAPSPGEGIDRRKLGRLGVISAAAILLHNLPEGMVTFMAGYTDLSLGLSMMAAIALHNIPEGMSVSIPIYYSTKSRWKAVRAAFLSGMSEPLGALLTYFLLQPLLSGLALSALFSFVAGLMVCIAFGELLPTSRNYGRSGLSLWGTLMGILVMMLGVVLMG